jgi:tRNA threonylcarbamoyladenosine biosynthesis protein TsaE
MIVYQSLSAEETQLLGEKIGTLLFPSAVVALDGPLGAGKTVIAKGLVKGALNLDPNYITSPAFSLVNEYGDNSQPFILYHMDFYRLENLTDEDFQMFSEYLDNKNGVVIAEWGSRFLPELAGEYLKIDLDYGDKGLEEDSRSICVSSYGGNRYESLVAKIQDYANNHH